MSTWLDEIKWDEKGLLPAIAQDHKTGKILMFAWMEMLSYCLLNKKAVLLVILAGNVAFIGN